MVVRELLTKLGFQSDTSGVDKADKSMGSFFKNISAGKLLAVGALAVVAKQVLDIGKAALFAAADMEMLTTQFEVMLGDAGAAESMMDKLNDFAASTPFALDTLAKGSQQLLSFGVAADDVVGTMRMLGDTAGGNAEKLNGLILAYGKVQVKGKASMEEINMIAERGLPIYDVLAKQLGTTKEGLFKMISAGKVSADSMKQAFVTLTSDGGMFFEGMKKQSMTFHGLMSTMHDNFKLTLAAAGKALLPLAKEVVGFMIDVAQALKPILETIFVVIATVLKPIIAVLKAILTPILAVLSTVFTVLGVLFKIIFAIVSAITDLFIKYLMIPITKVMDVLKVFSAWIESTLIPILDMLFFVFDIVFQIVKGLATLLFDYVIVALKAVWEFFSWIGGIIYDFLSPAFKVLGDFFSWIGGIIMTYLMPAFTAIGDVFDWIGSKIGQFVDWVISIINKLPGVNIGGASKDAKKVNVKFPSASEKMKSGASPRTTNVNMKNNITMKGTGGTKQDVERIAESIFTIQLKQVLTDAGI